MYAWVQIAGVNKKNASILSPIASMRPGWLFNDICKDLLKSPKAYRPLKAFGFAHQEQTGK